MSPFRGASVALSLLLAASCASAPAREPEVGPRTQGLQVRVENHSAANLRVLLSVGGQEILLGRVTALQERTLHLPQGVSGSFQLVARPNTATDDRRHLSEPFTLGEGQRMVWRLLESPGVASVPEMSSIRVTNCDPGGC